MYNHLLAEAQTGNLTKQTALELLHESMNPANALELFKVASLVRDERLGRDLWWSAGISAVLPCNIMPRCQYCTFFARHEFPTKEIVDAVGIIEGLGIRQVHLSGGTDIINGYDSEIIEMVSAIRKVSDIGLEVNLGPSISRETIRVLKDLNVTSITSSLETFDEKLFREAKPGDSLKQRKELLEMAEEEGLLLRSMMMIGLGESYQHRIEHLFYMQTLKNLRNLNFSRFNPFPGIPFHDRPRCSPWELARTVAVARLILPSADLGLAAGNDHDDIPLWYLAGGGNKILGASTSLANSHPRLGAIPIPISDQRVVLNSMPVKQQYIEGLGRKITFQGGYA